MVLVTNIYGEAAQLEETVRKDSPHHQVGIPPQGAWQGRASSRPARLAHQSRTLSGVE